MSEIDNLEQEKVEEETPTQIEESKPKKEKKKIDYKF